MCIILIALIAQIIKKSNNKKLEPEWKVKDHLAVGDEVSFEIESADIWMALTFNLFNQNQLSIYV